MSLKFRGLLVFLLTLGVLIATAPARAQDSIDRQISLLKTSADFRVRTQAALALGASGSSRAVQPLCGGLSDANTTVRIASAAAIGRLNQGGADCLKKRLSLESSATVKGAIERSLARLGDAQPTIDGSTKFFVAVGPTGHETGRSAVPGLVRQGMSKAASSLSAFAVAPSSETPDQAKAVFSKHAQLKGFYLAPKLSVIYAGGRLTVRLSVAMLTYPDKNVIGQFSKTMATPGVDKPDPSVEDELIELAAEAAMKQFSTVAASL
jgi:hypothetical protein